MASAARPPSSISSRRGLEAWGSGSAKTASREDVGGSGWHGEPTCIGLGRYVGIQFFEGLVDLTLQQRRHLLTVSRYRLGQDRLGCLDGRVEIRVVLDPEG